MKIVLNGQEKELADSSTVESLVAELISAPEGIAVAVNASVVPRSLWATTRCSSGDRVEVLTASPGG